MHYKGSHDSHTSSVPKPSSSCSSATTRLSSELCIDICSADPGFDVRLYGASTYSPLQSHSPACTLACDKSSGTSEAETPRISVSGVMKTAEGRQSEPATMTPKSVSTTTPKGSESQRLGRGWASCSVSVSEALLTETTTVR